MSGDSQPKKLVSSDGSPIRGRLVKKKIETISPELLKKGQLLLVKVPPFYDRDYLYEVTGAGDKQVRVKLYHSPRVKKQWSFEDLTLLYNNGMVRLAGPEDLEKFKKEQPAEGDPDATSESSE